MKICNSGEIQSTKIIVCCAWCEVEIVSTVFFPLQRKSAHTKQQQNSVNGSDDIQWIEFIFERMSFKLKMDWLDRDGWIYLHQWFFLSDKKCMSLKLWNTFGLDSGENEFQNTGWSEIFAHQQKTFCTYTHTYTRTHMHESCSTPVRHEFHFSFVDRIITKNSLEKFWIFFVVVVVYFWIEGNLNAILLNQMMTNEVNELNRFFFTFQ